MKPTRIVEGRWTVIHKLDIKPMLLNKDMVKLAVETAISKTKLEDFKVIYDRVNIIMNHVEEICNHLNIQAKTRSKRGLVNGLGSVIKAISGNLDQNDLDNIQKDLETVKVAYNKQISITDSALEEYNYQIKKITDIQNNVNKQLVSLSNSLIQQKVALMLLFQAQSLQDVSERLTTAITFAEHHMYHYSIIQSHLLQKTLNVIPSRVMISNNINDIEPFIRVNSRIIENIVYFTLDIPLVKPQIFNTRKIVPIIQNIPTCSYPVMRKVTLAYNELEAYEVEDCTELHENICQGSILQINTCETEVLWKQEENKCKLVPVKCPDELLQEITPKAIYIYTNKTKEITIKCEKQEETLWIKGAYLLNGENCELSISGIKRFQTKESEGKIIITNLQLNKSENIPDIELTYDAEKIENKLKQLKQIDELKTEKTHNIIQYGCIIVIIVIIITIILIKFFRSQVRYKPRTSKLEGDSQPTSNDECHKNKIVVIDDDITQTNAIPMSSWSSTIVTPWTSKRENTRNNRALAPAPI